MNYLLFTKADISGWILLDNIKHILAENIRLSLKNKLITFFKSTEPIYFFRFNHFEYNGGRYWFNNYVLFLEVIVFYDKLEFNI